MTSGMLDSFAVLNVVTFLEDQFGISIKPREAVIKNLNTISDITLGDIQESIAGDWVRT